MRQDGTSAQLRSLLLVFYACACSYFTSRLHNTHTIVVVVTIHNVKIETQGERISSRYDKNDERCEQRQKSVPGKVP